MSEDSNETNKEELAAEQEGEERSGGPLSQILAPDMSVWHQARNLITDKGIRVEELATTCAQDPVIVMELLRVANALYFSGGRSAITTVKNAIVRLGSDVVLEHLLEVGERPPIEDEEVQHWFSIHRSRCQRVSITATILAQVVNRTLASDCQTAALFSSLGEMLAVVYLKDEYFDLAESHSRSGLNYQLATHHRFDVERMGLKYLRKQGIPETILFALDREARTRNPERAVMRPLCFAAMELVEAFDTNRWEKVAPGKKLSAKSHLRVLQLDDSQYLKVYERVAEYLFSAKLAEQKKMQEPEAAPEVVIEEPVLKQEQEGDSLAADIENLLNTATEVSDEPSEPEAPSQTEPKQDKQETTVHSTEYAFEDPEDQFSLQRTAAKTTARSTSSIKKVSPPVLRTNKGTEAVAAINNMFEQAASSEELLAELLGKLTADGLFEKTALIVISRDRKNAIVVAARGPNIGNGQKIIIDDPLSPLAQCFSKVQSFGNRPNESSPFGSKAFAVAPIEADHDTPVALYADCGNNGSLTFEARRIFRTVVDLLNQKLPTIPGGIPVEL